jgi:hypothetical protein
MEWGWGWWQMGGWEEIWVEMKPCGGVNILAIMASEEVG